MASKSVEELARVGAETIAEDQAKSHERFMSCKWRPLDRRVWVAAQVAHTEALLLAAFDAHMNAKLGIKTSVKP